MPRAISPFPAEADVPPPAKNSEKNGTRFRVWCRPNPEVVKAMKKQWSEKATDPCHDAVVQMELAKEKVERLERQKEENLKKTRLQLTKSHTKQLERLESRLRMAHEEEMKELKRKSEETTQELCNKKRKELEEEFENSNKKRKDERSQQKPAPVEEDVELKSDTIKQEIDTIETHVKELNEHRSEMIWLLKQVIKADEKQKAKDNEKKNQEPRIQASKQA